MFQPCLPQFCFILYFVINGRTRAQDPGDVVNTLNGNADQCGEHEWQLVGPKENCGAKPCSFPQSWCSFEDGMMCVTLPDECQKKLQPSGSTTTAAKSTTSKTTTSKTTTSKTTTETKKSTTPSETTASTTTQQPETTSASPETTTAGTTASETTTTAQSTTTTATTAPQTAGAPVTQEPPLRPLPVGPNGTLIVTFKQVGDVRPWCSDNSNFCCFWARNNECNDNARFMQTYCRRSCQELRIWGPDAVGRPDRRRGPITIGGDQVTVGENAFGYAPSYCQDLHPKCRFWANRGECKRNSMFMFSICKAACDFCPCRPKCKVTCPSGGYGYGQGKGYGIGNVGGCQKRCTACGR